MKPLELLQKWMSQNGLDEEAMDSSGRVCAFLFNDQFPVSLEAPAYCEDLFVVIELLPAGSGELRKKRLEAAMQLNNYALETRGGVIGWDTVGERLVLSYRLTAEGADEQQLDAIISNLLEVAGELVPQLAFEEYEARQRKVSQHIDLHLQAIKP
ncbi:CesT family type III secretion system chaperone [Parendozoicomonas haliclonae]|uniref:Tir chaperone protein (CesT) n=1 Tax=Parendozoicomonas haliclonae TaxID=1960125 RepID=A0A1X7ANF4_9GAMM|nr:CesT family type III secretion system chaperone [Parendozoicomonas haliclonae]SMA49805.1 Tir chaperone protein (CesT) [Parendozoicomonas haliclonae]